MSDATSRFRRLRNRLTPFLVSALGVGAQVLDRKLNEFALADDPRQENRSSRAKSQRTGAITLDDVVTVLDELDRRWQADAKAPRTTSRSTPDVPRNLIRRPHGLRLKRGESSQPNIGARKIAFVSEGLAATGWAIGSGFVIYALVLGDSGRRRVRRVLTALRSIPHSRP